MDSHYNVVRPSYFYNGSTYTDQTMSSYWNSPGGFDGLACRFALEMKLVIFIHLFIHFVCGGGRGSIHFYDTNGVE